MSKKKLTGGIMAAAMALNCLAAMPFSAVAADAVKYEAEDATIGGVGEVATELSGYSGKGYVNLTDNTSSAPSVTFKVNVEEAGTYGIVVGYAASYGAKPMQVSVNGNILDGIDVDATEEFTETNSIKVSLNAGENTIVVTASWGWMQLDYITVGAYAPPSRPEITASHTAPSDPKATDSAKKLMTYLSSVYGKNVLSGQQEVYMYGHDFEQEFEYLKDKTGKLPAIRGFDFLNEANILGYGTEDGTTDRIIKWSTDANQYGNAGIATASWHLTVPKDMTNYKVGDNVSYNDATYSVKTWVNGQEVEASNFVTSNVLVEGTVEHEYYMAALKELSTYLLKIQDAGVALIWRPLHEAEGGGGENGSWFWWGKEGSKTYREIWKLTYKTLTEEYGIHNLIWEWNSYDFGTSADWYPGDEYVDIIGYDKYNCVDWSTGQAVYYHNDSAIPDTFYSIMNRYHNTKMVAMAENDSFSTVDNLTTEKAGWLYFCTWYDAPNDGSGNPQFLSDPTFNTLEDTIAMYQSDYCITLDELPKLNDIEIDPDATNEVVNTEATEPEEGHARISKDENGNFKIDLPEAAETIYLVVDLGEATYANGGLGVSVPLDGKYYWANVQWEASKSGATEVNLAKQLYNVTLTEDNKTVEIKDTAILDAVKEALANATSFQGQVWWAGVGAEEVSTSGIKITDAYVKATGTEDPTEPSDEPTDDTTPTEEASSTPGVLPPGDKYGDADHSGKVDILDVITVNRAILGKEKLDEDAVKRIDLNGNNKPDASDSLTIMKLIVGLVTEADLFK